MHRPVHCPNQFDRFASFTCLLPILAVAFFLAVVAPIHAQERTTVRKIPPTYPAIAKQMGITGVVIVTATVDASGKVIKAESTSGNKLLASAAIDAVKQWKFAPGSTIDTFPIAVTFDKN